MTIVGNIQKLAMNALRKLDDKRVSGALKLFLVLYAGLVAPKMPAFLAKLMKNPAIKLLVMFLIVFTGIKDPVLSLLIAIGFIVSMMSLDRLETVDSIGGIMNMAIDVPQELLNNVVDGTQDLLKGVSGAVESAPLIGPIIGKPSNQIVGVANGIIDNAQEIVNNVLDTVQEKIIGSPKEGFSMEDRTRQNALSTTIPDLTSLDGLSGFDESAGNMAPIS